MYNLRKIKMRKYCNLTNNLKCNLHKYGLIRPEKTQFVTFDKFFVHVTKIEINVESLEIFQFSRYFPTIYR